MAGRKKLPSITVLGIKNVKTAEISLEMQDAVFAEIVAYGKEVITDQKYFEVGFCAILEETLDRELQSKKKRTKRKT